jgi:hypothetical protein
MVHPDQQYEDYDSEEQAYADASSAEANLIAENDRRWTSVDVGLPEFYDFYWVLHGGKVDLAHYVPHNWQSAESAGDREGLNTEYFVGVTHWAHLEQPDPPSFSSLP